MLQMLNPKDIHPERVARIPEYKYNGDGSGSGGATEELEKAPDFDPYHMMDRLDDADALGSGAGAGAGAGAGSTLDADNNDNFLHTGYHEDEDEDVATSRGTGSEFIPSDLNASLAHECATDNAATKPNGEDLRQNQTAAARMRRELDEVSPKELEADWELKMVARLKRDGQAHQERMEQRRVRSGAVLSMHSCNRWLCVRNCRDDTKREDWSLPPSAN